MIRFKIHLKSGTALEVIAKDVIATVSGNEITKLRWEGIPNGEEQLQYVNLNDIAAITHKEITND